MTQDEIIEMAREAGGEFYVTSGNQTPTWYFSHSTIYDFVNLVAAKEKEACAKLAEEYGTWGGSNFYEWFKKLATEIRTRGEQA
jgi:hypothetical protein